MKSEINPCSVVQGFLLTHLSPFVKGKIPSKKQLVTFSGDDGALVTIYSYPLLGELFEKYLKCLDENAILFPLENNFSYPITTKDYIDEVKNYINIDEYRDIKIVIYPHNNLTFWDTKSINPYTLSREIRDGLTALLYHGVTIDVGHLSIKDENFPYYFTLDVEKKNEFRWSIYKTKTNNLIASSVESINDSVQGETLFIPIHNSPKWDKTIQKITKLTLIL